MSNSIITFRFWFLVCVVFCFCKQGFSQEGFSLPDHKKRDAISFKIVNNLVVIPVEVNGTRLSFLLDTGVDNTIIFSLTRNDSIELNNTRSVKLRGLGAGETITALRSENNTITIGDAIDKNHTIYFIFDQSLNLSTRMGVPIHGIIGYDFFKNFVVKTNYVSERLVFYDADSYRKKPCRRCEVFDLTFNKNKPYLDLKLDKKDSLAQELHLLLDSGSSDALWLFDEPAITEDLSKNSFEDFLGLGLSGNIFGKRSRIGEVSLGSFKLLGVNVAFPEHEAIASAKLYKDRDGSVGGDFLKRFVSIIDYKRRKIILRKGRNFSDPFTYNMSGLTLEHEGMNTIRREKNSKTEIQFSNSNLDTKSYASSEVSAYRVFEVVLVPRFVVAEVRTNSLAEKLGIVRGSELLEVNGKAAHTYKLYELNDLFSSKPGKKISLLVAYDGFQRKIQMVLEKVL